MKFKLLVFAAIVSCFISLGLCLKLYNLSDKRADNPVSNNNSSAQLDFPLSQNVDIKYSPEDLNNFKSLDSLLTKTESDLANYLQDLTSNNSSEKTVIWRRILKKNSKTSKLWNNLNELEAAKDNELLDLNALLYWRMFFDENDFNAEYNTDDFDERAFDYLISVDPVWVLRNAVYIHHNTMNDFKGKWPKRFTDFPIYKAFRSGALTLTPLVGIAHILKRSYTADRGEKLTEEMVRALTVCGYNVKGKSWTDIGSGSGCVLPFIREAIGDEASLTATELDPFTLDLLTYMAEPANAKVLPVKVSDCCLPADSQDIISMIGVHLGDDFPNKYEESTLPWLTTINKALRKDGVLIINDGNSDLLDKDIVGKVERAGFKLRKMFLPKEPIDKKDGNNCNRIEFIAVFEKADK